MGCDIHAYAEVKRKLRDVDEAWYCCEKFQLNPYIVSLQKLGKAKEDDLNGLYMLSNIYSGRNYTLFEALAGVRGEDENALFEVKNAIPDDCSDFIREEYERWEDDTHTPSYITIKELFSVDANITRHYAGYVMPDEAKKLREEGIPPDYATDEPFGNRTAYSEWSVTFDPLKEFKKVYFESYKEEYYYGYCTDEKVLEAIMRRGDEYRIVFWFDN